MANERSNNHVPGFEPVLLKSETKKRLKDYRFGQMVIPRDMHIERHMVSAAVEFVLSDEDAQRKWLEYIKESLKADIDQSMVMTGAQ